MCAGKFRTGAVGVIAALLALALAGPAWAGGPGVWTRLGTTDTAFDSFGTLRTADGNLHLVWLAKRASDSTQSYGTSTVSVSGKLLATGTALSGWASLAPDPRLVPDGSAIRLIFNGNTGPPSGCYARGEIFTETSTDGSAWNLVSGSLDQVTVGTGNIAATVASDRSTPVAVFAGGHLFHVGVDPSCPASSPDGTIPPVTGSAQSNPAAVTDTSTGAIYVASYEAFVKQGYYVTQILPTQGPAIEAPSSGATAAQNNQPLEPVALAARIGGGVYMAYCVASSKEPCDHIDLWKVGSSKVMVVPGSRHVHAARVALAGDTLGNMSVAWSDSTNGVNVIHSVRTNPAVTAWGAIRSSSPPAHTSTVVDLQAEGSSARLDLLVTDELDTPGAPIGLFQTQVLPGLSLKASSASFSHQKSKKVTFTVTDAGQPIRGAVVRCLGKKGSTNGAGKVKLKFRKGAPKGKLRCTAVHADYAVATLKIKVT
jgi:hypothetical protein